MGAAGGIGQPLSLLLKMSPLISHLNLYDIAHTPGVAADLSHIRTKARVSGFLGESQVKESLEGANVVIIPAGVPRKPGGWRMFLTVNANLILNKIDNLIKLSIVCLSIIRLKRNVTWSTRTYCGLSKSMYCHCALQGCTQANVVLGNPGNLSYQGCLLFRDDT